MSSGMYDLVYAQKLEKLQRYIPFLQKMISKLDGSSDANRAAQLQKMKHLLAILTDTRRRLKDDLLVKCEEVLKKLHDKVEGDFDEDVQELPRPGAYDMPNLPCTNPQDRVLYPVSEWERPSPPRETPQQPPPAGRTSPLSEDIIVESPPLSSFVERIRMSSPSSFGATQHPRSPSPEVVAQIPGAFTSLNHSKHRFEKGREILRKLMDGMEKTLDDSGVDREPLIIPLERKCHSSFLSNEYSDDLKGSDASKNMTSLDERVDELRLKLMKTCPTESSVKLSRDGEGGIYDPEDEWHRPSGSGFRPPTIVHPPLSKADLEELNKDLRREQKVLPTSNERSSNECSSRKSSGSVHKHKHKHKHRKRDLHSSDKLPGVNMDVFDAWKKREKVKLREKIKMERFSQDGNSNAPEEASHGSDGSSGDTNPTLSSVTTEKHQSTKSSDAMFKGLERHCFPPSVSPSSNLHRKKMEFQHSNAAGKRNYPSGIRIVKRSDSESSGIASHLSVGKSDGQQAGSNITDASIPSNITISQCAPQEAVAEHVSERSGNHTFDKGISSARHGVINPKPALASPADPRLHSPAQPNVLTAESSYRTMDTCSSSSSLQSTPLRNKLEDTYSCLLIKNLTKNTLRQDIFQLFTGFGMVETVLQVDFSYLCTGIAYAQFADHEEAKGAREHSMNKTLNGQCVKLSPCADGIYLEAKRAFEKAMNDREVQFSKRADNRGHVQHSQDQRNYHCSSNIQQPTSPAVLDPRVRAGAAFAPRVGVFNQTRNVRPNNYRGEAVKGVSNYNAPDGQQFRHTNSLFPRTSSPAHQKHSHQYVNPYNIKPGQVLPPKNDPRVIAKLAYEAAQRKRREEELLILRKHRGGVEKRFTKSSKSSNKGGPEKSRGSDCAVKTAALGTFKIPKLKKSKLPSSESKSELEPVVDSQSLPGSSNDGPQSYDIEKIGTIKPCHQEDVVSSTVDTETLIYPHGKKYSRKLSSDSDSESERICTSGAANENECMEADNSKSSNAGTSSEIVMKQAVVLLSKTTADASNICSGSVIETNHDESSKIAAKRLDKVREVSVSSEEMDCLQVDVYEDELSDGSVTEVESNGIVHGVKSATWEQTQTKKGHGTNELDEQEPKHSDDSEMTNIDGQETSLMGKRNSAEYEALKRQERKAKEKVEREFKEFAEREAKKRAYRETKANAELETIDSMEREARKEAETEVKEKAEQKAREQAEREVRENDKRKEKEKTERQARQVAEREIRENVERQERESAEREVSKKTEREAREDAEREATMNTEREIQEAKEEASRLEEAEKLTKLRTELEARETVELEAHERAEQLKEEQRLELERNKPIEPEECDLCSYSGKKIIGHYVTSHPGKHIPVKLSAILIQDLSNEELGPGDNSTYKRLSEELENQLLNDDLSWIPTSLMFDFCIACPYCKFTAMNRRHMLQHIANHLRSGKSAPEEYSMKCRFCKVKSVNTLELYDHLTSHTGEYRYSCGVCGFRVFRMYFLKAHMSSYHKGHDQCDIKVDNVEFENDWIYGFACKLCGFVQLNKARVVNHMKLHHSTEEHDMIRINMVTKGPKLDIARRVVDARRRKKAFDEKVAAAQPAPIENISAFMVSEDFIREESEMVDARKTVMCNVLSGLGDKSFIVEDDRCHKFMLKCIEQCNETPQGYLRSVRDRRVLSTQLTDKAMAVEGSQLPPSERSSEVELFEYSPVHWDSDSDSSIDLDMRPPLYHTLEAMSISDSDSGDPDKQLLVRLAKRVAPGAVTSPSVSLSSADGECLPSVKQEPVSSVVLNTDSRAAEGLSSMSEDLESLLQDFDAFEQEQQSSSLRIRKLSGDVLSADAGSGGLLISSVMSLSEPNDQLPLAIPSMDSTFDFPADGADRPWKFFLTLKDPSKVIRLMFHMHHKSAYKCSAVHCSFTTNNGTLFKLHLRNHERCDICVPSGGGGRQKHTCMNTRQVCVYCGYRGDDLAEHVYRRHAVSPFQCGYCFYRTRQNAYMHEHQRRWHGDMPTYFLQSDRANPPPGLNTDDIQQTQLIAESSLTPYVCAQRGCGRTFIKAGVFMQHCRESHPFAVDFPCHICHKRMDNFSGMIQHYVEHGYVAYNCAYCTYAHQQEGSMKTHLIDVHPDEPPKCYARIPEGLCESAGASDAGSAVLLPALLQVKQEQVAALPSVSPTQPDLQLSEPQSSTANSEGESRLSESQPSAAAGAVELQEAGDEQLQQEPLAEQLQPVEQQDELLAEQLYRCGGSSCSAQSPTMSAFKEHVLQCQSQQLGPLLQCFHCPKQVKHISSLLEHVRLHGPRRYHCALCEFRAPVANYVSKHLKQNHRITGCSVLPADAQRRDPERDEYVVYPRHCVPRLVQPAAEQLLEQTVDEQTPRLFGPDQLSELPLRAVLFGAAGCRLCDYRTHITRNLRKHLLRHGGEGGTRIPALVDPVNPRPCLGRSTRMSEMAVNLASGSKEVDEEPPLAVCQPRDVISDADMQRLPKEVSEDKRYVCSIKDCNYLTLNDTMLKYHIQALHGQMITYPCPHCDDLYMMPDRLSNHLRFHGPRLYKCRYCIYNHYQRKLVLRHVRDRHPLLAISDLVVREPPEDETAERRPALKPWRCGLCRHQTAVQADMVEHVAIAHDMRSQFKCALCSVRSSVRSAFQLHFASRHPDQPVKVFSVYYRVEEDTPTATPHQQLMDRCRPLWRRDDPRRIRHARGILIEQVRTPSKRRPASSSSKRNSPLKRAFVPVAAENPTKPEDGPKKRRLCYKTEQTKRSRAVVKRALDKTRQRSLRPRPAPGRADTEQSNNLEPIDVMLGDAKPSATTSLPNDATTSQLNDATTSQLNDATTSQLNDVATSQLNAAERDAATSATSQLTKLRQIRVSSDRTAGGDSPPDQDLLQFYETKSRDLGPTGSADLINRLMVCPRCSKYKSKKALDMRNHLYKEFSYNRFLCGNCGHTNTTMVNVRRHHEACHKGWPESITRLSPDAALESWVEALIDSQQQQLRVSDAAPQVHPQLPRLTGTQLSFTPEEPVTTAASQPLTGAAESLTPDDHQQRLQCLECGQEGSMVELKLHKRQKHAGQPLRVTPLDSYRHVCTVCGKAWLRRWSIRKHLAEAHPEAAPTAFRRELCNRNRTYRCLTCIAEFANRFLALQHCRQLHPDVQPPPVRMLAFSDCSDSSSAVRSVACPRCPFVGKSVASMGVHLTVHFKRFKCAHCSLTASSRTLVLQHIQQRHAGLTPAVHELEQVSSEYSAVRRQLRAAHVPPTAPSAVARKSTARGRRCVAVKSTAGSPRQTGFSYYGTTPPAPSHFSQVTSQLVLAGGVAMRVNLPTLSQIFKLYPVVKVTDIKHAAL